VAAGFAGGPAAAVVGGVRILLKRKEINKEEQKKGEREINHKMEEKMQKRRWKCKHLTSVNRWGEGGEWIKEYKKGRNRDQEKEDKK